LKEKKNVFLRSKNQIKSLLVFLKLVDISNFQIFEHKISDFKHSSKSLMIKKEVQATTIYQSPLYFVYNASGMFEAIDSEVKFFNKK